MTDSGQLPSSNPHVMQCFIMVTNPAICHTQVNVTLVCHSSALFSGVAQLCHRCCTPVCVAQLCTHTDVPHLCGMDTGVPHQFHKTGVQQVCQHRCDTLALLCNRCGTGVFLRQKKTKSKSNIARDMVFVYYRYMP